MYALGPQTWPGNLSPPEQLNFTEPLGSEPSFPYYVPPQIIGPIATVCPSCGNFSTGGNLSYSDIFTAAGGIQGGLSTPACSAYSGNQSYTHPYTSSWYQIPPSNDVTKPPIYRRPCSESQASAPYGPFPQSSAPTQQLTTEYPLDIGAKAPYYFQFGNALQASPAIVHWNNFQAMSAEIHKLKRRWQDGVGIKRPKRIKNRRYSHGQDCCARITAKGGGIEQTRNESHLDSVQAFIDEVVGQHHGTEKQETSNTPHSASFDASNLSLTDKLNKVIAALEEFQMTQILPSPEGTPTPKNMSPKREIDKNTVETPSKPPRLLRFTPPVKAERTRTLVLPKKETPTPKKTTPSYSAVKRVASLRPPKPIVRSSKPVTQPVPFNLVGEKVSRSLKLKREERRQSAGCNT